MKIVYFYLGQQGGGAALDAMEMAVGLSHHADVLCVVSSTSESYNRWIEESSKEPKMEIFGVQTSKNVIKGTLLLLNLYNNIKLISRIRKFKPDVVYSHMGHPYESVIIPFINSRIKAQGVHDVKLHDGEESFLQSVMGFMLSYKVSHYVVYSKFSCNEMKNKGIPESKILTTFLGCPSKFQENRWLDLDFYNKFLFFGRLIKYKGIDILLNSIGDVFEKHPDCKLIIAGRGNITEYDNTILKYKANLEIHNEWIEDDKVQSYFNRVDFVVAPYTDATQSGVVPLSYSFGKPIIASNSGGLPEQVLEGKTGLVVKAGDTKKLSEAIIKMLDDRERLLMMKKEAFRYFDKLSWDAAATQLYLQFESFLDLHR